MNDMELRERMKEIRVITLDLDGTALVDRDHFSRRLHDDLDLLAGKGYFIVPVTGRQRFMFPAALKEPHDWNGLAVDAIGSELYDLKNRKVIAQYPADVNAVIQLMELGKKNGLIVEAGNSERIYAQQSDVELEKQDERLRFHVERVLAKAGVIVEDIVETMKKERPVLLKINVILKDPSQGPLAMKLIEDCGLAGSATGETFYEVTAKNATKAEGLRHLLEYLHLPLSSVLSFGDSENDRSILTHTGISAVMGNAPQSLRDIADVVCDTNVNDGTAKLLEEYFL